MSTSIYLIKIKLRSSSKKEQEVSDAELEELQNKADEAKKNKELKKYNEYVRQMAQGNDMARGFLKQMLLLPIALMIILPMFFFVFPRLYETNIDTNQTDASVGEIIHYNGYRYLISNQNNNTYELSMVAFKLPFSLPLIGYTMGWFSYYIILSILYRHILLKKIHKKIKKDYSRGRGLDRR